MFLPSHVPVCLLWLLREAELISLDAGSRMDGIPALYLLDFGD